MSYNNYIYTFTSEDVWDGNFEKIYHFDKGDKFIIKFKNDDKLYEFYSSVNSASSNKSRYKLIDYISDFITDSVKEYNLLIDLDKGITLIKNRSFFDFGTVKIPDYYDIDTSIYLPYSDLSIIMVVNVLSREKERKLYVGNLSGVFSEISFDNYKRYRDGGTTTFEFSYKDKEYNVYIPSSFKRDENCKINDIDCFYNTIDFNNNFFKKYGREYNITRIGSNLTEDQ